MRNYLLIIIFVSFVPVCLAQGEADIKEMQKFTKRFLDQTAFYLSERKTAKAGTDDFEAVVELSEMALRYADLSDFHREEYLIVGLVENEVSKTNIQRVVASRLEFTLQTFELTFSFLERHLGNMNIKPVVRIQAGGLKRDLQQFRDSLLAMRQRLPKTEAAAGESRNSSAEEKSGGKRIKSEEVERAAE